MWKIKDSVNLKDLKHYGFDLSAGVTVGSGNLDDRYVDDFYGKLILNTYDALIVCDNPNSKENRFISILFEMTDAMNCLICLIKDGLVETVDGRKLKIRDDVDLSTLEHYGFDIKAGVSVGTRDYSDTYVVNHFGEIIFKKDPCFTINDTPDYSYHREIKFGNGFENEAYTLFLMVNDNLIEEVK